MDEKKEDTRLSIGVRRQGTNMRATAFFCLGLGMSDAWWLCTSTAAVVPPVNGGAAWALSLVLHGAYLAVQLICLVFAGRLGPHLVSRPFALAVGGAVAFLSIGAAAASTMTPCWELGAVLLACAAAGNALLFLGWMRRFSMMFRETSPFGLILASMACGAVLWAFFSWLPSAAVVGGAFAFPVLSAMLLGSRTKGESPAGTPRFTSHPAPLFKLLSPLLLGGIFIYELAPGMVTSLAHINGMAEVYRWYALGMVVLALASFLPVKSIRFSRVAFRLIAPLISLGLIAFALASVEDSAVAMSATLMGSMLFEAFLFVRFAEVAVKRREEPVRVFALGGLAAQMGILVAYVLVPLLAESVQVTIATLALVIVFLLVLTGAFFSGGPQEGRVLTQIDPLEGSARQGAPTQPPADRFGEECAAFAEAYGLSRRESEVFELAMQGKNQAVIAKELFVAETTVKTHLRSIYRKTDTANRQELIALFLERRSAV